MVPMVHFSDHATNDPLPGPFQPHVSFQPSPLEGLEGLRMLQHQWQIRVVPIYIWCIPMYPSVCSIVVIVFINSYWSTKYVTANLICPSLIWVSVSPTDYILSFSHQYCHFGYTLPITWWNLLWICPSFTSFHHGRFLILRLPMPPFASKVWVVTAVSYWTGFLPPRCGQIWCI